MLVWLHTHSHHDAVQHILEVGNDAVLPFDALACVVSVRLAPHWLLQEAEHKQS